MQILFCIDKARKRSFTEVALNSVLEENAASAIDFEWEFYSPNKNIFEPVYLLCFPIISSPVQSRHFAYCAQCSAYCAQTNESAVFEFFHGMGVFANAIHFALAMQHCRKFTLCEIVA